MPMFEASDYVVDRSDNQVMDMPPQYDLPKMLNQDGIAETCGFLENFKSPGFGHVSYLPEYHKAIQKVPTKVLFNIRDPRDIVIAEFEKAKTYPPNLPFFLDYLDKQEGIRVMKKADPIAELIRFSAARWPRWLGWLQHNYVMPVKFEDLRWKTHSTVAKIAAWLSPDMPIDIDGTAQRRKPKKRNPTFRRGISGEWMVTFTSKHKKLAEELLGEIIRELGYEV